MLNKPRDTHNEAGETPRPFVFFRFLYPRGTLTYTYDSMDRVVKVAYPDGTNETTNYYRLDVHAQYLFTNLTRC